MRYIALLRGINVGGNKQVSMADLRELLLSLGHSDVSTYIQSGNALFTSPGEDAAELEREIEERMARDLGMDVHVLIRTPDELAAVIENNPFPDAVEIRSGLHVTFLSAQPDEQRIAEIDRAQFEPDRFAVGDRVIYLRLPNGMGRSKLATFPWERRLGVVATTRNWNTVQKLLALANPDTAG